MKAFFEKHCTLKFPCTRTLETTYVDRAYGKAISAIHSDLKDSPFWLGIDGNTDACKRPIANVLVGKLGGEKYHRPHLVNVTFLEGSERSEVINRIIERTLAFFGFDEEKFCVYITDAADAASYCLKSGDELREKYQA